MNATSRCRNSSAAADCKARPIGKAVAPSPSFQNEKNTVSLLPLAIAPPATIAVPNPREKAGAAALSALKENRLFGHTYSPSDWHDVLNGASAGETILVKDPNGSNASAVIGDIRIVLNGSISTLENQTLRDFGDSLDRSIGIGRHPNFSTEHYRGLIYAPAVYLGVVPEPSTSLLAISGLFALSTRRRRSR